MGYPDYDGQGIGPEPEQPNLSARELVNHPKHYNDHPSGVECIVIVEHMTFNVGTAIKHLWRHGQKGTDPAIQDLEKARWYIDREIQRVEQEIRRPMVLDAIAQAPGPNRVESPSHRAARLLAEQIRAKGSGSGEPAHMPDVLRP